MRVTGALAAAASQVEVPRTPGTGAPRYPRRQAVLQAEGNAVAATIPAMGIDWDADRAVTKLYTTHYRSLVRLAALLVRDVATAEEVVQDSFVAMHSGWRRLRDSDKALSYLRQSVVNRSRSVLRHRIVADRNAAKPAPDMPSAEHDAIVLLERSAVVTALRTLPPRQREALVLRYYGDRHGHQPRLGEEPHGTRDERAPCGPRTRRIARVARPRRVEATNVPPALPGA